jgi:hypothetical protein
VRASDNISAAFNVILPDVDPHLTIKEELIINVLSSCGAAFRSSLELFWHPLKGRRKIQALLNWGVLWSHNIRMGESMVEIVTLSPLTAHGSSRGMYIPRDSQETVRTTLATELYLRVLKNVPCEFDTADHPLQGAITARNSPAGILVLLRNSNTFLRVKERCFIICQDETHIKELSQTITFPALYITQEKLLDRNIDIARAFCDGNLEQKQIGSFMQDPAEEPTTETAAL